MENIIEGLMEELKRNRELLKDYESIGPNGAIGAMMIKNDILRGEKAIEMGSVVEMVASYESLKGSK